MEEDTALDVAAAALDRDALFELLEPGNVSRALALVAAHPDGAALLSELMRWAAENSAPIDVGEALVGVASEAAFWLLMRYVEAEGVVLDADVGTRALLTPPARGLREVLHALLQYARDNTLPLPSRGVNAAVGLAVAAGRPDMLAELVAYSNERGLHPTLEEMGEFTRAATAVGSPDLVLALVRYAADSPADIAPEDATYIVEWALERGAEDVLRATFRYLVDYLPSYFVPAISRGIDYVDARYKTEGRLLVIFSVVPYAAERGLFIETTDIARIAEKMAANGYRTIFSAMLQYATARGVLPTEGYIRAAIRAASENGQVGIIGDLLRYMTANGLKMESADLVGAIAYAEANGFSELASNLRFYGTVNGIPF